MTIGKLKTQIIGQIDHNGETIKQIGEDISETHGAGSPDMGDIMHLK